MKAPTDHERARWLSQWAQMESAGIPALKVAESLVSADPDPHLARFARSVRAGVAPAAAARAAGLVTPAQGRILGAAFTSGRLEAGLHLLAQEWEGRAARRDQFRSAMVLPVVVLILASFLAPLPALVADRISGMRFLIEALLPPVLLVGGVRFLQRGLRAAESSNTHLPAMLTRLPLLGSLLELRAVREYLASLSLALKSGLPAFEAMELGTSSASVRDVAERSEIALADARAGLPLAQSLERAALFGNATGYALVSTGEHAGRLEEMLDRHVAALDVSIKSKAEELARWIPRWIYALIAVRMIFAIVGGWSSLLAPIP